MTTFDMPTIPAFTNSTFYLKENTQIFESPLNRVVQRIVLSGALWVAAYSLPTMKRNFVVEWQAFFLRLEGRANTFNAFDPEGITPRGTGNGTPLVNGASQTGSSLVTDGWANNEIVLKIGDYFTVNDELKMVVADVLSDGSGNATINFKPALRESPGNNAPLTIDKASCKMILFTDEAMQFDTNENSLYLPKTFSAREAIT